MVQVFEILTRGRQGHLSYEVNIKAADRLVIQGARAAAGMV